MRLGALVGRALTFAISTGGFPSVSIFPVTVTSAEICNDMDSSMANIPII